MTTRLLAGIQQFNISAKSLLFAAAFCLGIAAAQAQTSPDNTGMNKGDESRSAATADRQGMSEGDRALTQQIRKSVMSDKSLSTYAHNVKIISRKGIVTLRGPVRSGEEKASIVAKAVQAAGGADKVKDQMSVTPESK